MTKRWRIKQHLSEVTQITAHPNGEPEIVTATRGIERERPRDRLSEREGDGERER